MDELIERIVGEMGLSRRQPQEVSLRKMAEISERTNFLDFDGSPAALQQIETISQVYAQPSFKFETPFPSYTFALATGVGKTRLMGACIYYLYKKQGFRDFLLVVKGETLFEKLKAELDPNNKSDRYLFYGLSDMFNYRVILPDQFDKAEYRMDDEHADIFLLNIEQFAAKKEARRFYKRDEALGKSKHELLIKRKLAVMLDESHRYKAEVSFESINNLKPKISLEFTATPITVGAESRRFKNILHEFKLKEAIERGYVKIPRVIAWRNDELSAMDDESFERTKIKRGIFQHERKRKLIQEFCEENNLPQVIPFILISAKDTEHAADLRKLISEAHPYYANRTIEIHSNNDNEDDIRKFLELEKPANPDEATEIVIHVNKLKEGWDVKNLYTLIPLRASAADLLVEQTLGRGLRLPFNNQRTGRDDIDTFEIIAHDKYDEIVAEAKRKYGDTVIAEHGGARKPLLKEYQIKPDGPVKMKVRIPRVHFEGTDQRGDYRVSFKVKCTYADLKPQDVELIGTKIGIEGKQDELIAKITPEIGNYPSLENFLFRKMLQHIKELSTSDRKDLEFAKKISVDYLGILRKKHDEKDLQKIMVNHFKTIMADIQTQISIAKDETTDNIYKVDEEAIEFHLYKRNLDENSKEIARTENEDARGWVDRIVTGYGKSIFTKNLFDSKEEKLFADILEDDDEVVRWVKPPLRQSPIAYENVTMKDYNPDFFVETKHGHFVVEVKRADEIEGGEKKRFVFKKAKAARDWCVTVSAKTKEKWEYCLIPHSKIRAHQNFVQTISSAVMVD